MNLSKFSIVSAFLLLSLFLSTPVLALDPVPNGTTPVATIGLDGVRIVSQEGNTFNIAFTISNREIIQTGVKYSVQLIPDGTKYSVIDEKVYDESLTLDENVSINKQVTYTAPSYLSGDYMLILMSSNESNFPFGLVPIGKVKLTATTKAIQIIPDSCYTQVEGEKGSPKYSTVNQSVDISATEVLKLTCTAVNNTASSVTVTPVFETRDQSSFGKVVTQTGGDAKPVAFAKGEKKTFSVMLPKGEKAGIYYVKMSLSAPSTPSNTLGFKYIIRGANASLQKVSLDKDYYRSSDKGEMAILWSASAGNFQRSGIKYAGAPKVTLKATIKNDKGKDCIEAINQPLVRTKDSIETKIPFDVKSGCMNPSVSASILDSDGKVLDQKEFNFTTVSKGDDSKPLSKNSVILIVVALLVLAGIGIYMKKKKGLNTNTQ